MVNIKDLKKEQEKLAKKVILKDEIKEEEIKTIAGVDQSYTKDNKIISAIVVLDYKTFKFIEKKYAVMDSKIPYIPGFLSYREAPAVIEAFNMLRKKPDIIMFDCNGIIHPRKIGMASHVGILLDTPTVGVAKNLLIGEVKQGNVFIEDKQVGFERKTKEFTRPVYISPGHKMSLKTSLKIFEHCIKEHKLPEPVHQAHKYAVFLKNRLKGEEVLNSNIPS